MQVERARHAGDERDVEQVAADVVDDAPAGSGSWRVDCMAGC